jgi:hypothetical protein
VAVAFSSVTLQQEMKISHRLANAGTVYMRVSEHSNNLQVPRKLNNALT